MKKNCDIYDNYFEFCDDILCRNSRKCIRKDIKGNSLEAIRKRVDVEVRRIGSKNVTKRVIRLAVLGHKLECACCGSKKNLTFDHVIPLSKGGEDNYGNGQILCKVCNGFKDDLIIPLEALRKLKEKLV